MRYFVVIGADSSRYLYGHILAYRPLLLRALEVHKRTVSTERATRPTLGAVVFENGSTLCVMAAADLVRLIAQVYEQRRKSLPEPWYTTFCKTRSKVVPESILRLPRSVHMWHGPPGAALVPGHPSRSRCLVGRLCTIAQVIGFLDPDRPPVCGDARVE